MAQKEDIKKLKKQLKLMEGKYELCRKENEVYYSRYGDPTDSDFNVDSCIADYENKINELIEYKDQIERIKCHISNAFKYDIDRSDTEIVDFVKRTLKIKCV